MRRVLLQTRGKTRNRKLLKKRGKTHRIAVTKKKAKVSSSLRKKKKRIPFHLLLFLRKARRVCGKKIFFPLFEEKKFSLFASNKKNRLSFAKQKTKTQFLDFFGTAPSDAKTKQLRQS
jgi:hypothetical protein